VTTHPPHAYGKQMGQPTLAWLAVHRVFHRQGKRSLSGGSGLRVGCIGSASPASVQKTSLHKRDRRSVQEYGKPERIAPLRQVSSTLLASSPVLRLSSPSSAPTETRPRW
jgi:hypothetical protein